MTVRSSKSERLKKLVVNVCFIDIVERNMKFNELVNFIESEMKNEVIRQKKSDIRILVYYFLNYFFFTD